MSEPSLMERTRAAVTLINRTTVVSKQGEFFAFLSLFHPEIPWRKRLQMAADMAREERPS